jgi:hypothetical protein
MKHLSVSLALLFCVLIAAGCGGNAKVTGKVAFPDGEPLSTGRVVFENEKISAMGKISEDGSYTLGTDQEKNGVPQGKYRVYIAGAVTYGEAPPPSTDMYSGQSALPPSITLINQKYRSPDTSGLEVDVQGNMVYDIKVEKP